MTTATELRRMLNDGTELALIDVREEGIFARDGHLLLASNVPLSHLEMRIPALVPRSGTRIVLCDGAEGRARVAADTLAGYGYTRVDVLEGGTAAWTAAGERLYTGVYVPSKAFGEYVHHHDRPSEVTPQELDRWKRDGRSLVILDSRPPDEYSRNTIPGSIDCPSAELAYRVHDLVRSNDTTIVVNCGGRTRAIIGAQALINAGITNRVYALKDGTQGWHLAGLTLAKGATDHAPAPSPQGIEKAKAAAARVARRFAVRAIDLQGLATLQGNPARTVYLLDVRTAEEFHAGHPPGSIHAPGGQLVQATDTWLAVRHAAVVLVDDHGVRATMTASWLNQMGWREVYVLTGGLDTSKLERGSGARAALGSEQLAGDMISVSDLQRAIDGRSVEVVDFAVSLDYRDGHVPGAWHAIRSRIARDLTHIPGDTPLVFTSPDGVLARYAARDAARYTDRSISVLAGGTSAWRDAGGTLESGDERLTGPMDDLRLRALDQKHDVEGAMREYLQWEVALVKATDSDPDFAFRRYP